MAIDTFLYFTGADNNGVTVKGESTDSKYKDKSAIEIFSWSWGASNPVTIGSSSAGSGAGKVSLSSLSVSKKVDTASPMLFLSCCQGGHFPKVNLEVRKSGTAGSDPYMILEMGEVFIESLSASASSEEGTETVSMAFGNIVFKYAPQDAGGKIGTLIPAGWDAKANVKK
jgi:type VI secretion system secreted protein Hcp